MILNKISPALLGTLLSLILADSVHERFHTFGISDDSSKPWFIDFPSPSYAPSSSSDFFDNLKHGSSPIGSFKKPAYEDKSFKKLSSEDLAKSSHCQEIPAKESSTGVREHERMTCYRCKEPQAGTTYEHCSYSSRPSSRSPRSNAAAESRLDGLSVAASSHKPSRRRSDDAAEPEDSDEHRQARVAGKKNKKKSEEKCERVRRDSMECLVCAKPNGHGKYERCSYVAEPNEKAFTYSQLSSFGEPKTREQIVSEARKKQRRRSKQEDEEEDEEPKIGHLHYKHEPEEGEEEEAEELGQLSDFSYQHPSYYEAADEAKAPSRQSSARCKTVTKDGQRCSVCTEPKTGGQSERCEYAYEPKDKAYSYTKASSFGYPEHSAEGYDEGSGAAGSDEVKQVHEASGEEEEEDGGSVRGYSEDEASGEDYARSESERVAKKTRSQGQCREERRDSMICKVCRDPRTNDDSEQCSYSYDPKDKVYAYTRSKSFGSSAEKADAAGDYGTSAAVSSEERPEETYARPVLYPTTTSVLDYQPEGSETRHTTTRRPKNEAKKQEDRKKATEKVSKVDAGFYDAKVRRAEIEKIVKDFGSEDRSKCKKTRRGSMTCYRCTDGKGSSNEECVYLADEPGKEQPASEASAPAGQSKILDSLIDFDDGKQAKRRTRETKDRKRDKDEELEVLSGEVDEAEPYELVSETRPVYDKVLGMTLPAYMVNKSPIEIAFDQSYENARF